MNIILWDFDGTLAYRHGMWSGTLASLAQRHYPKSNVTIESIRPHLQSGFPWHEPDKYFGQRSSNQWWTDLQPVFSNAFKNAGLSVGASLALSKLVKDEYIRSEFWSVYEDVEECLTELSSKGWMHHILSNHVPELPSLAHSLGLGHHFEKIITSAKLGFEKPHPSIFDYARKELPENSNVWMVGDSYTADIEGAESQRIPAILVRKEHKQARFFCSNLHGVVDTIVQ